MSDKQTIISVIAVTLVLLLMVIFIVSFVLIYHRRQFRNQQEKKAMQDAFDREILRTQQEIQEQTFQMVSHEIHDNVGQMLSVARIYVNSLRGEGADPETEGQAKLGQVHELLGKAIQDLRDISKSRNADFIVKQGLYESLRFELQRIARSGAFQTGFTLQGEGYSPGNDQSIVLFRICQELINNSIRHSGATTIRVDAQVETGGLCLTVSDDGCGFDTSDPSGSGLSNIHRRAELIGAAISIRSEKKKGTQASINLAKK